MTTDTERSSGPPGRSPADDPLEASRMSFGDHLEELRTRLILALVGVAIGTVISLVFGKEILEIIFRPLLKTQYHNGLQPQLQALAPTAGFAAYLKIGIMSGLILTMPWVLYQIWRFVATGLYGHERRFVRLLVPTSTSLFIIGVLFLYFIVLPIVLQFFITFNRAFDLPDLAPTFVDRLLFADTDPPAEITEQVGGLAVPIVKEEPASPKTGDVWVNATTRRLVIQGDSGSMSAPLSTGSASAPMQSQFAIDFYISFVLMLAFAFGIAFEMPIVVFFLAWTGLVPTSTMTRSRRYVLLGTVIAAAILTPPDVISQLLLAAPMYLLFEVGVRVARLAERKSTATAAG